MLPQVIPTLPKESPVPRRVWTLLLALSFASFGCEESKPTGTAPTASAKATAAATTTAAASATSSSTASAKAGNMTHCPSSVDGATTEIKDTKEGVDLVVKAKDDAAVKDVRARAAHLVEASKNESGKAKHTGEGEGGGQFGRCPVVMKETTVEAKDVEGGSSISVKAKEFSFALSTKTVKRVSAGTRPWGIAIVGR